ncbi:MAG: MBL fold metallo-hydrolase [Chloroflexi bacterium]|nr:MBL fold metallo-hydrolase [Chloroflexota bacterium]MCL5276044.1 MBL fold metallo-hydrolase [Chloroflexota bacterium]
MSYSAPIIATIVYDNQPYDPRLTTHWGFACLFTVGSRRILFDTGANGAILLANLAQMDIDPQAIDMIVVSHYHSDHTGGLLTALPTIADGRDRAVTVLVPRSFPDEIKQDAGRYAAVVDVNHPITLGGSVYTTGELGQKNTEQSLALETADGLIVITGCAHSGIVEVASQARRWGEIALVMGGFHLKDAAAADIKKVIEGLRKLGVKKVAPSHCTGQLAIRMFAREYGRDFIPAGAGAQIMVGQPRAHAHASD